MYLRAQGGGWRRTASGMPLSNTPTMSLGPSAARPTPARAASADPTRRTVASAGPTAGGGVGCGSLTRPRPFPPTPTSSPSWSLRVCTWTRRAGS